MVIKLISLSNGLNSNSDTNMKIIYIGAHLNLIFFKNKERKKKKTGACI
jgi:hypothetical protein